MAKKKSTNKIAPKKPKKRVSISQRHAERVASGKETKFFEWLREKLYSYCKDDSISKKEQLARREELASHLEITTTALKASYLYGQNKENVYKGAVYIGAIDEEILVSFIESYPALSEDLKSVPTYLKEFYSNFKKLNSKEQELLSNFVRNLIELNQKYDKK